VKLAFIGCGFMGEALLKAALSTDGFAASDISVAEVSDARRADVAAKYNVFTTVDSAEAVNRAEIVLFATKPQEFEQAAASVRGDFADRTAVSIMAGVRSSTIAQALGTDAVVRIMPNTPAAAGEGASIWTATTKVSEEARTAIARLLDGAGMQMLVDDEKYLDMATALIGSGPGFVYLLIEAFVDAGVHIGFKRDVAEKLALQTFAGSARYAQQRGEHLAQLRNEVTSPGGTTAAGLLVLEEEAVRATIIEAIAAAYERSRELGGG
jgi:pyrroline-5-carboxylate reductase